MVKFGRVEEQKSGVQAVRYQTRTVQIHNVAFLSNTLNIYQLITEYLYMRKAAGITCTRFFLGVRSGKKVDGREFWRNQPLGRNTCMTVVKSVCTKLGIRGDGEADFMTTHGLRATMTSLLISASHSDAAFVFRTGHRDRNSLQNCHNLCVIDGETQWAAVFRGSGALQGEFLDQVLCQAD